MSSSKQPLHVSASGRARPRTFASRHSGGIPCSLNPACHVPAKLPAAVVISGMQRLHFWAEPAAPNAHLERQSRAIFTLGEYTLGRGHPVCESCVHQHSRSSPSASLHRSASRYSFARLRPATIYLTRQQSSLPCPAILLPESSLAAAGCLLRHLSQRCQAALA
jgi:hypothetical protein